MGNTISSSSVDIAVSGLRAQALNMKVIASNIAHANTTKTANGEPYRRQQLILSAAGDGLTGVNIDEIASDVTTDFKEVYTPGHPDADAQGYVKMPNVELPVEMMNMVSATRAYQANASILKRYQENVDLTLELLK